jgi:type III secretion protein W
VGSFRGQAVVRAPSQTSLIEDALEELTETVAEDEEKELSKREVEEGSLADVLERILEIADVRNLLENLTDLRHSDLERFLVLALRNRSATPRQLREQAQDQFEDPSHQYAALAALLEGLKKRKADPARIAAVQQALDGLLAESAPEVKSGLNVTSIAAVHGDGSPESTGELRATYRDAVLDYKGLPEAYSNLVGQYGTAALTKTLKFLIAALGADLAATGSSVDKSRLRAIVDDLYRLEVLGGISERCDKVMGRLGAPADSGNGAKLMHELLTLMQDRWPTPEKVGQIPPRLQVHGVTPEVNFLREFKELIRITPLKAYTEPDSRQHLIDAAQLALDNAIDKEEEEADA